MTQIIQIDISKELVVLDKLSSTWLMYKWAARWISFGIQNFLGGFLVVLYNNVLRLLSRIALKRQF